MTVVQVGTRKECAEALRIVEQTGAWDFERKVIVRGRLVGKPKWSRHDDHWHVEQEMA